MWPVFLSVQPRSSISFMVTGTALACGWAATPTSGRVSNVTHAEIHCVLTPRTHVLAAMHIRRRAQVPLVSWLALRVILTVDTHCVHDCMQILQGLCMTCTSSRQARCFKCEYANDRYHACILVVHSGIQGGSPPESSAKN